MEFIRKHPAVMIILGVDLIAVIITIVIMAINLTKSAVLDVSVAPSSAKVIINEKEYKNGKYDIVPGEYKVEILAEGFEPKEKEIVLKKGEITRVYDYLVGEGGDMSYYETNAEDRVLLESVGKDEVATKFLEGYEKKAKIKEVLPLVYSKEGKMRADATVITIEEGGKDDCSGEFCLVAIDVPGGNMNKIKEMIREKGFNPDDYEIVHKERSLE